MSQPRRRRRRRRRGGGGGAPKVEAPPPAAPEGQGEPAEARATGRSRRRRRRGRAAREERGPQSLEEVVSEVRGARPARLTADPDGQTLEGVIGELQSIWGVPQYPQEYRITLKVADEKPAPANGRTGEPGPNGVTRERAPAAPRVVSSSASGEAVPREKAPRRRRRSRRGRRRGGSKGDAG